jgi:hypothetical protein
MRLKGQIGLLLCLVFSQVYADKAKLIDGAELEKEARKKSAQQLMNLSNQLENKVREEGAPPGDTNPLDGNPFLSQTTFHTRAVSTCLKWFGDTPGANSTCERWVGPYVSTHGFEGGEAKSTLEGEIAKQWNQYVPENSDGEKGQGNNVQYGIWNIKKSDGGSVLDADKKLDFKNIQRMELLEGVAKKVEDIGYDTAQKQLNNMGQGDDLKRPEDLRFLAREYTQMYRKRMLSIVGQVRAAQEGVEAVLDNETFNCDSYFDLVDKQAKILPDQRLQDQARLDPMTYSQGPNRKELCKQMMQASAYQLAPRVKGDKVEETGADGERYDEAAARLGLLAVDFAGKDPREMQALSKQFEFTESDVTSERGDYEEGGKNIKKIREKNGNTIAQYNNALKEAAYSLKKASQVNPYIGDPDGGVEKILSYQINPGETNLIAINGLTAAQKEEYENVSAPHPALKKVQPQKAETTVLERTPEEINATSPKNNSALTITPLR